MTTNRREQDRILEFVVILMMATLIMMMADCLDRATLARGRQQGVSASECGPDGREVVPQVQGVQGFRLCGRLAQSVELRTFNPLPTCNQYQPRPKLGGFTRDFDARSASGCAGLHGERASGGRQEGGS